MNFRCHQEPGGSKEDSILKSVLINKDFKTWLLICLQHSCQPIGNHVRKSLLIDMDFNMDFI